MKQPRPARAKLPNIGEATESFERWVAKQVQLVPADLSLKHWHMAEAVFPFLRATFYRWAQLWPQVCPEASGAPKVLTVGDLHVENFGTWRDAEGRLVWGVNDFDEAWPAAYTADLVRLTASAYLAIGEQHLAVSRREARQAIESGYRDGIAKGGGPYVLAEKHNWLRKVALSRQRDPIQFWKKIESCRDFRGKLPKAIHELLHGCMPLKQPTLEMKTRVAGLGSLGHPRVLGLSKWHGAHIVREAKQLTRSAWIWAQEYKEGTPTAASDRTPLQQENIINHAVRIPDPHMHFLNGWEVRRLAPDCCHIELCSLPEERDEERLLYAMGWDTANLHLGSAEKIPALKKDLGARSGRWLRDAAKVMAEATENDWELWRKAWMKRHGKRERASKHH
jgi:Uncharacterized protein conserved in bacteria (DUF2252)